MKHLGKIALLTMLLGILFPSFNLHAADQFVSNFQVLQRYPNQIRLSWNTADRPVVDMIVKYQVTGDPSTLETHDGTFGDPGVGDNSNYYTVNGLKGDTSYTFWVEYEDSNTINGDPLSGFADFDQDEQRIISETYTAYTAKESLKFNLVDKSYVYPGEKIKLYGNYIGEEKVITAHLGPAAYLSSTFDTSNTYEFEVTNWTDNYIEFEVPEYDADMSYQQGKLYFNNLIPKEGNYSNSGELFIKVLSGDNDVDRAIASGYTEEMYRYLLNSSRYRYNNIRTSHSHGQEEINMRWVSEYLADVDKGIDATWSLVLAYGITYGGYSQDEIRHEINFGPGCIHTTIPQSDWSQTYDYVRCMANEL